MYNTPALAEKLGKLGREYALKNLEKEIVKSGEAWKKTHETIEEIFNSELIQKAKEQYTNVTGIRFQNRKPTG